MTETELRCPVCKQRLKSEVEQRKELCWVCLRLKNSVAGEKLFPNLTE